MSRIARLLVVTLVVFAAAISARPALAATAGWQRVDVTMQGDAQPVLLVAGELPATAKLPYKGELAVPAGTQIQWVGQILGGAGAQDPAMEYTKTTVGGLDVYHFTLTKSRIAQIEGNVDAQGNFDGKTYATALKWTAWQALPEVRINRQVPAGAQIVQAAPGASLMPGDAGNAYYTKTVKNVKAGDVVDLTFSYSVPAAGASAPSTAPAAPASSNDTALYVVLGVFVVAVAFFAYQLRRKLSAKRDAESGAARKQVKAAKTAEAKTAKAKEASARAAEAVPDPDDAEVETAEAEDEPRQPRKVSPAVATMLLVAVLVGGTMLAARAASTAKVAGDTMTRKFGTASPCATTTVPVAAKPGVDLAKQGDKLLAAFEGKQGVTDVTLNLAESTVDIGFCESQQSDVTLSEILAGTGLVSVGAPLAKPAPAGTGGGQ